MKKIHETATSSIWYVGGEYLVYGHMTSGDGYWCPSFEMACDTLGVCPNAVKAAYVGAAA